MSIKRRLARLEAEAEAKRPKAVVIQHVSPRGEVSLQWGNQEISFADLDALKETHDVHRIIIKRVNEMPPSALRPSTL